MLAADEVSGVVVVAGHYHICVTLSLLFKHSPVFFSLFLCTDILLDLKSLEPNYWVVAQFHPGRKDCKYGEILNTHGDVI